MSQTNGQTASVEQSIWKWQAGRPIAQSRDRVVVEEPLEIRVRGRAVCVTMRTPGVAGEDGELAAGFLLSEGLITAAGDIARIDASTRDAHGNVLNVFLAPHIDVDFDKLTRHVFASSSCGLCGKATIDAVHVHFEPIHSDFTVRAGVIVGLPDALRDAQATFDQTGGLHAAALFDEHGELIVLREDVGRHNAVDKVLGHALLNNMLPLDRHMLLVSGRSSFEILQKALAGRVAIVAAVSAPSSLAVEFAADSNQTLIGFLRGQRMNIYSHRRRIRFDDA